MIDCTRGRATYPEVWRGLTGRDRFGTPRRGGSHTARRPRTIHNMNTHTWDLIWGVWIAGSVGSFLGLETYALITDWRRTLSAAVWRLEDLKPGQPISGWTVAHVMFVGLLALLFVWLLGHFAMGWWR